MIHGNVDLHQQQVFVSLGDGLGLQLHPVADSALEFERDVSFDIRVYRNLGICAQGGEVGEWAKEGWHTEGIRRAGEKERAARGGHFIQRGGCQFS